MANCKDCIHYKVCCQKPLHVVTGMDFVYRYKYNHIERECKDFKDRSQFIELPCKVRDILYHPVPLRNMIAEYKIKSFQIYPHCVWVNWNIVDGVATINTSGIYANEIGETVFFTKEAAEQALKERESNG